MESSGETTTGAPAPRGRRSAAARRTTVDEAGARAEDGKADGAFRTISEVATLLDVQPHVLQFWETRFAQLRPMKRAGGRRYYRPADVALLSGIRKLLHDDGMAIRGVQKLLREQGVRAVTAAATHEAGAAAPDAEPADGSVAASAAVSKPSPEAPAPRRPRREASELIEEDSDEPDLLSLMMAPAPAPAPARAAPPPAPANRAAVPPPEREAPAAPPEAVAAPTPAAMPPEPDAPAATATVALPELPEIDEDPAVPVPVSARLRRSRICAEAPRETLAALCAQLAELRARLG